MLEIGAVIEGEVTGITNFGAFVDLGEGKTGMVHISEVSSTYVKEIRDHLTEGQKVKVKVLSMDEKGKVGLSIKKAEAPSEKSAGTGRPPYSRSNSRPAFDRSVPRSAPRKKRAPAVSPGRPGDFEWQSNSKKSADGNFEDMMSKFKQNSEEKISELKRSMEGKNGGFSRRGSTK